MGIAREPLLQYGAEALVFFDGENVRALPEQNFRERTEPRPDFQDVVSGLDIRQGGNPRPDDRGIDKTVRAGKDAGCAF